MADISVSIVNFNTKELLCRCLDSIQKNAQGFNLEVIVADNNSNDGSKEMLKESFPYAKVIFNKENSGAARAKNQTFKEAGGRYILILDSDIEILSQAIRIMVDFMEANPEIGILGPRVLFPDLRQQHSCNKSAPNLFSAFLNKFFFFASLRYRFYSSKIGGMYLKARYSRPEEFSWLGGMCLLARRELIQQINGMDEGFFIYYDDTDFCLRAKKAGWKVYYLPYASVIHHMSRSVRQFSGFLYPKIFASELCFFKKHYGDCQAKIYALFIWLAIVLRLAIILPLFLSGVKKNYFRNKIDAYRQVICLAMKEIYAETH